MKKNNPTKKIILALIAIGLFGLIFKNFSDSQKQSSSDSTKPTVKIGVIAPLTGDSAILGQNCMNGIKFALENIKNSGVQYEVMFEDDAFQLANAAKIANKFVNVDKVDVLFTCSSPSGSAAVSYSKNGKKFMFTVIASAEEIAENSPYSFLHWTSPKSEGSKAAELVESKKAKKVVIFEQNHSGAKALGDSFREALKEKGIQEITYTYMASERNFHDMIAKADRENADIFMLLTLPPSIDIITKNLKEKGITTPYTSIELPTIIEDKSAFENVEFIDVCDGDPEIINKFKKKHNTENTFGVAFAYDGIMIINHIINDFYKENKRVPNSEELTNAMYNLKNWNGVVGEVIVDSNRVLKSNAVLKIIKNGKPVAIEE